MGELNRRLRALEKVLVKPEAGWWSEIEDHVQEPPGCFFVRNSVDELRAQHEFEPLDSNGRRDAGLGPDVRTETLRWMTAEQINHWARSEGLPAIPLTDIFESANLAGHYVMSQHSRPIEALGIYAFLMTLSDAEREELETAKRV